MNNNHMCSMSVNSELKNAELYNTYEPGAGVSSTTDILSPLCLAYPPATMMQLPFFLFRHQRNHIIKAHLRDRASPGFSNAFCKGKEVPLCPAYWTNGSLQNLPYSVLSIEPRLPKVIPSTGHYL